MKIDRAVITEQTLTINLTTADLIAALPPKVRKQIADGATFEAAVTVPVAGRVLLGGADVPIVCTVFVRSAAKVAK